MTDDQIAMISSIFCFIILMVGVISCTDGVGVEPKVNPCIVPEGTTRIVGTDGYVLFCTDHECKMVLAFECERNE